MSADTKPTTTFKPPTKMLFVTAVIVLVLVILNWQFDYFNEHYNINPGLPNLMVMGLTFMMVIAWAVWTFFWAKLRLVGLLIFLLPAIFLTLYYPNFGGDANITGWKPRFWKSEIDFSAVAETNGSGIALTTSTAKDFPQFLGPQRNGVVTGVSLSDDWKTTAPARLWKQPVGEGWSGFAAVNGFAITQEQRGVDECVTCYDIESGELLWIKRWLRRHEDIAAMGKVGPRATPTIDNGLVYVTSGTGVLDCLDGATGEVVWTADVPALVGISQKEHTNGLGMTYTMEDSRLMWGRAGSPLIDNNRVIVTAGGPNNDPNQLTATLIAFDKLTGHEIWRGGKRMIAYGSPTLATVLGKSQIVLVAEDHAVGHDPETGTELWSHLRSGHSNGDANCSQVSIVSDSQLILSKGYGMGGELIELTRVGDEIKVKSLVADPRVLKTKLTSPMLHAGHAYSLSDGYLECTEVPSLRRKWKQRGRFGNGQLLVVGDRLLVHTEDGELMLIAADPTAYQELASMPTIKGTCWNTLCLFGNRLLVRSDLEAACFELPVRSSDSK